jgi:serine/threonine protein kinase
MSATTRRDSAEDDLWRAGGRLDRYELEKELGRGGMGVVYLAKDLESDRKVAIKTLLSTASDPARKRFLREGEAQAAADAHPNVLRIRAAGEIGGRPYLVMDFAPGGDLAHRVKKGPLPPLEAARIARDLARGLAHVHARGVIHRDLKPANVLFSEDGNPQLVDFGLAKIEGAEKLTATGAFLGTPAYMAPEQTGGDVVDVRADVYAMGAMLYQMLAGRVPFEGAGAEVVAKVITQAPASTRAHVPSVPKSLDRIVLKCLAKSREDRYPTAESLAQELDKALAGAEVEGGGRRTVLLLAVSLVVVGLVFAATWWWVQHEQPPPAPPAAAAPVVSATTPPPPKPRSPLESLTWGFPAKGSKSYRLQCMDELPSDAIRNILATLELGDAEGPDAAGVVRCRGKLSELDIWAGDRSNANLEHSFGDKALDLVITVTSNPAPNPPAIAVDGLDEGHKRPLLESIPEKERWAPNPLGSGVDDTTAWTGSTLKHLFTNEFLARALSVILPGVGRTMHGLQIQPQRGGYSFFSRRAMILLYFDKGQLPENPVVSFEGTWKLDAEGTLESAKVTEFTAVKDARHNEGRVTWNLGPRGSFRENHKP